MRCPDCRQDMVILEVDEVELDLCIAGHGSWFDAQELGQLFAAAGASGSLEDELAPVTQATEAPRACPRCARKLRPVALDGGGPILDRCPAGHGLWFDPGEVRQLAAHAAAADRPGLAQVQDYLARFFPDPPAASGGAS